MVRKFVKTGSTARFGARYGVSVRKQMKAIEDKRKAKHQCPKCQHMSVKRRDTGIWVCRHCNYTFAGGAYVPKYAEPTKIEAKMKEEAASGDKNKGTEQKPKKVEKVEEELDAEEEEGRRDKVEEELS